MKAKYFICSLCILISTEFARCNDDIINEDLILNLQEKLALDKVHESLQDINYPALWSS